MNRHNRVIILLVNSNEHSAAEIAVPCSASRELASLGVVFPSQTATAASGFVGAAPAGKPFRDSVHATRVWFEDERVLGLTSSFG
jgi:hypothetical protein